MAFEDELKRVLSPRKANIQYSNILSDGMNTDVDPVFQPGNTYTFAEGFTVSNGGHDGLLQTEEGNSISFNLPDDTFPQDPSASVIGSTTIDNLVFIFSTTYTGRDYISICNKIDGTTKLILINIDPTLNPSDNYDLGFDINYRIKAEAKILYNGDIGLYFTDNLNPIRYIRVVNVAGIYSGFLGSLLSGVSTPLIDVSMADGGGSISCSSYLFAIAYTNSSGAIIGYSTFTNPYPVTPDALPGSTNTTVFDGAYNSIKANKVFNLTINESSFDPAYTSFQIALITFVGFSNTPTVYLIGINYNAIFVGGQMQIQITGSESSTQISLAEVTIPFANYRYAKEVSQLYNRLLFANLRVEDFPADFDSIANQILLTPAIKEVDTNIVEYDGTGGYKDGGTCVNGKSLMRNEVYSFGIVFIIDGHTETNVYHLAAPKVSNPILGFKYPPGLPGQFGTYYANQQEYKQGSPYFISGEDDHVRYHVVPKYDLMQSGSDHIVQAIGVNVTNVSNALLLISDLTVRARVTGYRLVRRQRDIDSNKTILSQGLIQKYLFPTSGFSDEYNTIQVNGYPENSSQYDIALANPSIAASPNFITGTANLWSISPEVPDPQPRHGSLCGFISPEVVFGISNPLFGTRIVAARNIGAPQSSSWSNTGVNGSWNFYLGSSGDLPNLNTNASFTWYTPGSEVLSSASNTPLAQTVFIDQYWISPSNTLVQFGYAIDNTGAIISTTLHTLISQAVVTNHLALELFQGDSDYVTNGELLKNGGGADSYVMNIENNNENCYTTLYSSQYINCGLIPEIVDSTIFGGDTFISRFTSVNQIPISVREPNHDFGTLVFGAGTYIESQYNCDLRHQLTANSGSEKSVPYVDYISTSRFTATFQNQFFKRYGIQDSTYNDAYSAENNFNTWLTNSQFFDNVYNFENRIIYSDQSIDGEGTDSYIIFRQNNYKDIPKNRGPIWNMFVYNNDIYAQCISSTYKTNMQPNTIISTTNGSQAVLGVGSLFSIPEQELITISGGYGGSQDSFSGVNTPMGRYFIDRAQGKVFLMSVNLEEISMSGMYHFFLDNTEFVVPNLRTYQENDQFQNPNGPVSHGCSIGYDSSARRLIITRRSTDDSQKDFTISYSLITGKWTSFHQYAPNMYINSGIELYTCINAVSVSPTIGVTGILWKHRGGIPGSFYNQIPYNSVLEISVNDPILRNKVIDNLIVTGETILQTGAMLPLRPAGDFLKISSKFCNSGSRSLEYSNVFNFKPTPSTPTVPSAVSVGYYNRQYQLSCPRSLVQNSEYSNPLGIDINNIQPDMLFAPRLKDTYFIVRFDFANKNTSKISIDAIMAMLRLNIR